MKKQFVMSMYASGEALYKAKAEHYEKAFTELREKVEKLRGEVKQEHEMASNPPAYMQASDYDSYAGKELALDDVLFQLNKVLNND